MPKNPSLNYVDHSSPTDGADEILAPMDRRPSDAKTETPALKDEGQFDFIREFLDGLSPEELQFACTYADQKEESGESDEMEMEEHAEGEGEESEKDPMKKKMEDKVVSEEDFSEMD